MKMKTDWSLYLVLDRQLCSPLGMIETTRQALAGGVSVVQLRDKEASNEEMIEIGRELKKILKGQIPLIVNDNLEVALAIEADGLHLGQKDLEISRARARLGPDKILGLSIINEATARKAPRDLIDYAGVGPVFATPTKEDHDLPIGWTGLERIIQILSPLPCVAIGEIKQEHISNVFKSGAQGLAVVSAICGKPSPLAASETLIRNIRKEKGL